MSYSQLLKFLFRNLYIIPYSLILFGCSNHPPTFSRDLGLGSENSSAHIMSGSLNIPFILNSQLDTLQEESIDGNDYSFQSGIDLLSFHYTRKTPYLGFGFSVNNGYPGLHLSFMLKEFFSITPYTQFSWPTFDYYAGVTSSLRVFRFYFDNSLYQVNTITTAPTPAIPVFGETQKATAYRSQVGFSFYDYAFNDLFGSICFSLFYTKRFKYNLDTFGMTINTAFRL